MSIRKRNSKNLPWEVRWRVGSQHKSRSFRTKNEALEYQGKISGQKLTGNLRPSEMGNRKFSEVADDWYRYARKRKDSTNKRHLEILRLHILPTLGELPINKISRPMIQKLVHQWSDNGLKPRTVQRHLAILKAIFNDAVHSEHIDKSPVFKIDVEEADQPHRRPLTVEEFSLLISHADIFWKPHVSFLVALGIRISEFAALNISNLNFENGTITITDAKSAAGKRTLKLTPEMTELLELHFLMTDRTSFEPDSPLFLSKKGKRISYGNFRKRVVIPLCMSAGIPELKIHDFRRTTGTLVSQTDTPPVEVQTLLGHSDFRTTNAFYVQSTETGKANIAQTMSELLGIENIVNEIKRSLDG